MMILNEIKIISKYIDTYFNCDDISKVPDIYTLTSFPDDAIVNFDILKHSIITAMKKTINYKQIYYNIFYCKNVWFYCIIEPFLLNIIKCNITPC